MMAMHRVLKGKRIAVLAADGFEQVELTIPVAVLRLAGAAIDVVSLRHGRIRGVNLHEPARLTWSNDQVDPFFDQIDLVIRDH